MDLNNSNTNHSSSKAIFDTADYDKKQKKINGRTEEVNINC